MLVLDYMLLPLFLFLDLPPDHILVPHQLLPVTTLLLFLLTLSGRLIIPGILQ